MSKRRIFQCYDHLAIKGGAESVSLFLQEEIKDLYLYIGGINKTFFNNANIDERVQSIFPFISNPLIRQVKQYWAFSRVPNAMRTADVGIYSGVYATFAVHSSVRKKIHYCHTIPRFAFDLFYFYYQELPYYKKPLYKPVASLIARKYFISVTHMDLTVCNSENTRRRLKRYLGLDSIVVHPPVETKRFHFEKPENYYLSIARLEDYKRVELIIRAFLEMKDKQLVVVSGGSLEHKLRKLSANASNIKIVGWVSESVLANWMSSAIATLYIPIDEDFGLSPVESMAAGKPVIGVNEGGLKETILDRQTGYLCPKNVDVCQLTTAVNWMTKQKALGMKDFCIERARQFDSNIFAKKIKKLIDCQQSDLTYVAQQINSQKDPDPEIKSGPLT